MGSETSRKALVKKQVEEEKGKTPEGDVTLGYARQRSGTSLPAGSTDSKDPERGRKKEQPKSAAKPKTRLPKTAEEKQVCHMRCADRKARRKEKLNSFGRKVGHVAKHGAIGTLWAVLGPLKLGLMICTCGGMS